MMTPDHPLRGLVEGHVGFVVAIIPLRLQRRRCRPNSSSRMLASSAGSHFDEYPSEDVGGRGFDGRHQQAEVMGTGWINPANFGILVPSPDLVAGSLTSRSRGLK
jgi:hypothetical protein